MVITRKYVVVIVRDIYSGYQAEEYTGYHARDVKRSSYGNS